ncbi:MAG: hypothetical protein PHS14_04820 [Elusimicrobia bacterium]|nr:hypothetical protein [Elusimicrobiota bacterium]
MPEGRRIFRFRLSGQGISPETVEVSELIEILEAVRDAVTSLMPTYEPETKNGAVFSLVEITKESLGFVFKSSVPKEAEKAVRAVTRAIKSGNLGHIPAGSARGISRIASVTKRKRATASFMPARRQTVLAEVTPGSVFTQALEIDGATATLYGKVEKVGGATPKVTLRLSKEDMLFSCDASEEIAKDLGKRLYEWVGVEGSVTWRSSDLAAASFRIAKILPYREENLSEGFRELAALIGPTWANLNVMDTLEEIRGD